MKEQTNTAKCRRCGTPVDPQDYWEYEPGEYTVMRRERLGKIPAFLCTDCRRKLQNFMKGEN